MSITQQFSDVVELASRLVAIPSVNPELADDAAIAGEARLADFLASYLDAKGFAVNLYEVSAGRPNVIGSYGPDTPRRHLMIEAHLDTQGIHGMTVPPFDALVRDGKLYGRGACDMKGPMAAALFSLNQERLDALAEAGVRLTFAGAIGEETGNTGANELVEHGLGADELLVLEPTDQHIVHAHKGVVWFEVELNGVAAHGSNPDAGRSAVRAMSQLVEMLYEHTAALPQENLLLGRPTINAGIIRGGTSTNIVPDRCILKCDRRTVPGEDGRSIIAGVQEMVDELASSGAIVSGVVRGVKEGVPFETTTDSALVKRLCSACEANGVNAVTEGAAWYSDAGPLSQTCREVAVFGPGSIRQAHTADEFIEITELNKGTDIIGAFLDAAAAEGQLS